ncbi:ubiquitin carboxyl-terminal hydrolase 14 [Tanacetum coccineum]
MSSCQPLNYDCAVTLHILIKFIVLWHTPLCGGVNNYQKEARAPDVIFHNTDREVWQLTCGGEHRERLAGFGAEMQVVKKSEKALSLQQDIMLSSPLTMAFISMLSFELGNETQDCNRYCTRYVYGYDIVAQLASMGFNRLHYQKAAINTSNAEVEKAMNWLLSHMDDPDIDAPIDNKAKSNNVDPSKVATHVSFGFDEETASKAGGDIEKATHWIFNPPAASSSGPTVDATLPDGFGNITPYPCGKMEAAKARMPGVKTLLVCTINPKQKQYQNLHKLEFPSNVFGIPVPVV